MTEFVAGASGESEANWRQFLSYLFAQDSTGLATDGALKGLAVTQTATASASVLVASGGAIVQDSVANGAKPLVSDATKTLDILTADPMGATPRNDIVVFDSATTSIRNIVGTPNAVPTDPTVPATAVPLARLRHAASATTVPTASIDDLRVFTRLAESVPQTPAASGSATFASTAAATVRSVAVTFPAGRFAAAPKVVAMPPANFFADPLLLWATSITTTGFTLNAYRDSTSWGPATVDWVAVQ